MTSSQNGYPAIPVATYDGPLPRLRRWAIPGTDRHLILRDGSAGFVLVVFALWFHEKIERLDLGVWDEWGWAYRDVRGATVLSNHASATAADLNATRHPLGVPTAQTFTPGQMKKIRRKLRWWGGVLRWGGDYANRPDAMHFELDKPLAAAERLARRLMLTRLGRRVLEANPGARQVIKS